MVFIKKKGDLKVSEIISKALPIILLTIIGLVIRKYDIISQKTVDGIKNLIVKVCLPMTLFLIFLNMELKKEHLWLILAMMFLFCLFYLGGAAFNEVSKEKNKFSQFFCTGFSFGLVGVPLFTIVFGAENLGLYSIMGLSHEMFVWFIYYPVLAIKMDQNNNLGSTVAGVLKSPLNISIALGVLLNLLGLKVMFYGNQIGMGVINTLEYLSSVNAPLILICIGYGMNLDKSYIKESTKLVLLRLFITFVVGYGFKIAVLDHLVTTNRDIFAYSFFALIVLPPLLSLPIFLSKYGEKKGEQLVNNATVQSTIVSMVLFIGYSIFKSF